MKHRLTRHLFIQLYGRLFFGVFFFSFFLLSLQIIRRPRFLVHYNVTISDWFSVFFPMVLSFQPIVIPTAMIFASFSVFGHLVEKKEWLGALSCGVGIRHIFPPILFFFILPVSTFSFFLNAEAIPKYSKKTLRNYVSKKTKTTPIKESTFLPIADGLVLFAQHVDSKNNTMRRVFLYDERTTQHPTTTTAEKGRIFRNFEQGAFSITLNDGLLQTHDTGNAVFRTMKFSRLDIGIDSGISLLDKSALVAPAKTIGQLLLMLKQDQANNDIQSYKSHAKQLHLLFALPSLGLILSVLAFSISLISYHRFFRIPPVMKSTLFLSVNWILFTLLENGELPVWLSAWLPNMLFLALLIVFFYRKRTMV